MTPDLVVAGGVAGDGFELAYAPGDAPSAHLTYAPISGPVGAGTYSVSVEPWRLVAAVRRTDHGWIATAAELNALGYGATQQEAVDELLIAVEQYLEFLRDDEPRLAPAVAHHANYVPLLHAPRGTWLAAVIEVDASAVE